MSLSNRPRSYRPSRNITATPPRRPCSGPLCQCSRTSPQCSPSSSLRPRISSITSTCSTTTLTTCSPRQSCSPPWRRSASVFTSFLVSISIGITNPGMSATPSIEPRLAWNTIMVDRRALRLPPRPDRPQQREPLRNHPTITNGVASHDEILKGVAPGPGLADGHPVWAVDHNHLDEGRPLRLEDAYPIAYGRDSRRKTSRNQGLVERRGQETAQQVNR